MLTFLKALDISKATAQVAPDLLKALGILSEKTFRTFTVDREDLNNTENQKKGHIPPGDQKYYYLQVFQRLY